MLTLSLLAENSPETISTMQVKKLLKKIAIALFWVLLWQIGATVANMGLLIAVPTPVSTVKAFLRLCTQGEFWLSAVSSLYRVIVGFLWAVAVGTVLAFLSNKLSFISDIFSPVLRLMRAVPVAAFIILVFLWVPDKNIPALIAFLTVLPIIWENCYNALSSVDKALVEMARVMGMRKIGILRYIVFPSIKPAYIASLVTGLGFAFKSGVAAEVISRTELSLGNLLWIGKNAIDYDEVFAVTAVIVIFSILLEQLLAFVFRKEVAK